MLIIFVRREVCDMLSGQYTEFWYIQFSDIFGNIGHGILIYSVIWFIWKYRREFFGNQCCTRGRALFLDRSHRCQGLLSTSLKFIDYHWVSLIIIDYLLFSVIDHTNAKDFLSPVLQQKCWTLEIIFSYLTDELMNWFFAPKASAEGACILSKMGYY